MLITKREGNLVEYNSNKVIKALNSAFLELNYHIDPETLEDMLTDLELYDKITVEEIQDQLEAILIDWDYSDVSAAFKSYRDSRAKLREQKMLEQMEGLFDQSDEYLMKENANKRPEYTNVQQSYLGGIASTTYCRTKLFPKSILEGHDKGAYHIHDIDMSAMPGISNCIEGSAWIKIHKDGEYKTLTISEFSEIIGLEKNTISNIKNAGYQILSRDGWTGLNAISCRETKKDEILYELIPRSGIPIKLTGEHRLPVIRNEKEILCYVKDIQVGDELLNASECVLTYEESKQSFLNLMEVPNLDLRITNLHCLKQYIKSKYGLMYSQYCKAKKFDLPGTSKHIKVKDFITLHNEFPLSLEVLSQLRIKAGQSKHSYPLFIPFSEQLAKLYAYIYADGGVYVNEKTSMYHLTFTNTNEKLVDDFIQCFESVFGDKISKIYPGESATSPCIRACVGSRLLVNLFKDFAGARKYGASEISMPDFVLNGPENIQYAYLSACIDTDGCLGDSFIEYVSCCKKYCEQLTLVLQNLGYEPHIKLKDKAGSIYRFYAKSGTRNYDSYSIRLFKTDDKARLIGHLSCFKSNDSYCYKGISSKFSKNRIEKINTSIDSTIVYDLQTDSHWYIVNNFISHNCSLLDLRDALSKGTVMNEVGIDAQSKFVTACTVATQVVQGVAGLQYGGITVTMSHLAPYLRMSAEKIRNDIFKYKISDGRYFEDKYHEVLTDGVQTFMYQVNSMMTTQGQTPFLSVCLYLSEATDEDKPFLADIIEEVLKQRIQGFKDRYGNWVAPAFPKLIYVLEKDNIYKDSKYYYLTKLCAKCNAGRMVPDYISAKKMKEIHGYVYPSMGK